MNDQHTMPVAAIKNGTVIDHIPAGNALKILSLLNLTNPSDVVTVGLRLPSGVMGAKDILKISERELTPEEANQVALLAPEATINIIRDYKIAEKYKVRLPKTISRGISCPNGKCVSREESCPVQFQVERLGERVFLTCSYCERSFTESEMRWEKA